MIIEKRLEQYTIKHPQEVLIVRIETDSYEDEIAIFKGFSSSLMRPTASDPDLSIIPEGAKILAIDRLASPYNPNQPIYIQQGLSWQDMEQILSENRL